MASGEKWAEQEPDTISPRRVINCIRWDVMHGYFNLKDWDHASPNYQWPRSNKALRIAAAQLANDETLTHDEAVAVVLDVALGFRLETQ